MQPSIEVDDEVFGFLQQNAEPLVDTPNSVLRRLLGLDSNGEVVSATAPVADAVDARTSTGDTTTRRGGKTKKSSGSRAKRGSLLPESEYELPILRYLDAHDGRAPSKEVVEAIGRELDDRLTDADKQPLNSGEIRWKSRAAFVRLRLVERGELDGQAPRGTWQLTDEGRERLNS